MGIRMQKRRIGPGAGFFHTINEFLQTDAVCGIIGPQVHLEIAFGLGGSLGLPLLNQFRRDGRGHLDASFQIPGVFPVREFAGTMPAAGTVAKFSHISTMRTTYTGQLPRKSAHIQMPMHGRGPFTIGCGKDATLQGGV